MGSVQEPPPPPAPPADLPSGKLVALEGDLETISTQLRLLPPSQKILVLPPLAEPEGQEVESYAFNARAFIRQVHTAFKQRTQTAKSFLEYSTAEHPRIAFTNGGSVTARTICIARISEHITHGELAEAETIFNDIVKDGVAGLEVPDAVLEEATPTATQDEEHGAETPRVPNEDHTAKAMRAAEDLDREYACLEDDEEAEDLPTNASVQEHADEDADEDGIAPEDTSRPRDNIVAPEDTSSPGDAIVTTTFTLPSKTKSLQERRENAHTPLTATTAHSFRTAHDRGSEYNGYESEPVSPGNDSTLSVPTTPAVVYGEACVVDMQSASLERSVSVIRRSKSMDRFHQPKSESVQEAIANLKSVTHAKSLHNLRDSALSFEGASPLPALPPLPTRASFMRASQTTIRRSPTSTGALPFSQQSDRTFVDRGVEAGPDPASEQAVHEPEPFEPVFPLVEDLVIIFPNDAPSETFTSILNSYKTGAYPVFPPATISGDEVSSPTRSVAGDETPTPRVLSNITVRPLSNVTAETDDDGFHRRHEFDPYAYGAQTMKQWPGVKKISTAVSTLQNVDPLTPADTPVPQEEESAVASKFCDFTPLVKNSVIGIQNSLRALLSSHFPPAEGNYSQYYFPVAPEADRFWKPVWRNDENSAIGTEGRTVDQVIALGSEDGVPKDFFTLLTGQVERLGSKRDGLSKSGRLDIRYLMSNALQAASGDTDSDGANPTNNPQLLATLLVPQLEAYLATNSHVRLLVLTYPADHLATVLALRKMLGQDIFKVAGVLDSQASGPPSITRKTSSPSHPLSNQATASPLSERASFSRPTRSESRSESRLSRRSFPANQKADINEVSFSRANYLLPSTATDVETASFLSSMRNALVEKSQFYTSEPEPEPVIVEKIVEKVVEKIIERPAAPPTPTPSNPPLSYRAAAAQQSRESKISRLTGGEAPSIGRRPSNGYAQSINSVRTTASEAQRREEKRLDDAWANFYIGEEDSEDDEYDKMILGRAHAKIIQEVRPPTAQRPKRSTKKALKWLGLA